MSPLRLLLVTDAVGGVWIYSLELARALRSFGVEALLAVTGPSPSPKQRNAAKDIRLIDTGLPLEWLDTSASEIIRASDALSRIAVHEGADVVQTSSAALLAGASFDCATIAVQHSCLATWWAAVKGTKLPSEFEWRRDLVSRGLARADSVVAPTAAFADATACAYRLDASVVAVHNGRTPRESRRLPQGDFAFTASRLWDEAKNAKVLDRAAARIGAPFQAAGSTDGPNGAQVTLDHLITIGELTEEKLGGVLAARPVYASAAVYEPFGLSVLEAAQAGCALVLSDIPTHRELWNEAAIFVGSDNDEAFAAAIEELLNDRGKRNAIGERARERARRYTPDRMASRMAAIYSRVRQPQLIAGAA
jgi:glycosyltransferase involved in cell wall biosynthesis